MTGNMAEATAGMIGIGVKIGVGLEIEVGFDIVGTSGFDTALHPAARKKIKEITETQILFGNRRQDIFISPSTC
jgi:hypothetical protein